MYSVTIIGNVEQCRTEAEDFRRRKELCCPWSTKRSNGWHTDLLVEQVNRTLDFQTAVEHAKEKLSHYVNRRGENPPEAATRGAISLWLMLKDDGTALGVNWNTGSKLD